MEIAGLINKYRRLLLKAAPLVVLALIWLWFVIVILVTGSQEVPLKLLFGWSFMV